MVDADAGVFEEDECVIDANAGEVDGDAFVVDAGACVVDAGAGVIIVDTRVVDADAGVVEGDRWMCNEFEGCCLFCSWKLYVKSGIASQRLAFIEHPESPAELSG